MAGKNKKEIRSFEAQNVRFLRSSSLTRILRLLIKTSQNGAKKSTR